MNIVPVNSQSAGSDSLSRQFSIYVLPGRVSDPRRAAQEARDAAAIGLGGVWISERFASKEPAVLCGALASAIPGLRIAGTFYAHLRHPVVTASIANIMQALTQDQFILTLARASPEFFAGFGVPDLTLLRLRDLITIFRRLWRGETIEYDGPLGRYQGLRLTDLYHGPAPPIVFTAVGPKALAFAGEHCDGVLLHPMLSPDAVASSAAAVRRAADAAGRDPMRLRVISTVIVAPDLQPEEERTVVGARAVTYLQAGLGSMLAQINGWNPAVLEALRSHPTIAHLRGKVASQSLTREQLAAAAEMVPDKWLRDGAVAGSARYCADRLRQYLDAGADEILLHGSAPSALGNLTAALRSAPS
jgi:5,10-methylenetetrahydromethanopterin reductase